MKSIKLVDTAIKIPFTNKEGEEVLVLSFDRSDVNTERLNKTLENLSDRAEELKKQETEESMSELKGFLKETTDSILGDGAFEKVYALSPSLNIVALYLYKIALGIKEELEGEEAEFLDEKYLS